MKHIFDKMPTGLFVYGNYAKDLMIDEGFDEHKLHVVHNSLAYSKQLEIRKTLTKLPLYEQHFGNTNPNLMFVGRLDPVKKLDMILNAMVLSKQNGKSYNLTLIGGGVEEERLKNLAKE